MPLAKGQELSKIAFGFYTKGCLVALLCKLQNRAPMSSSVIDLTADATVSPVAAPTRKRKLPDPLVGCEVWLVIHQLEPQEGGVGTSHYNFNHMPDTFDASIQGVYTTRGKANRAALDCCRDVMFEDFDEDEEDVNDDDVEDFVGEGRFKDGGDSGDVHTYSERVHVVKKVLE
jgi:hypothetical protein